MHFNAEAVMSRSELKKMPQIIKSRNSILLEFNSPSLFCFPDFDTASEHPSLVADTCRQQQTYSKILYFLFPFPILCVRCMGKKRIDRFHNVRFHYDFFDILF